MATGSELLRALGGMSPVAPATGAKRVGTGGASQAMDFSAMLERARAGELESGLPVQVAPGAEIGVSEEQLARLGPIIDRLHATGASHALIAIDGRLLVVDVLTRQVRSEFDPSAGEMVEGIDAVASAAAQDEGSAVVPPPGVGVMGPSLARALGREEAA